MSLVGPNAPLPVPRLPAASRTGIAAAPNVPPSMSGPVADRRPQRPLLRRPRAARLLLPRELVALARRHDPRQDAPGGARQARRLIDVAGRLHHAAVRSGGPAPCKRGATQVEAIARRVDEVVVVADRIVQAALPANARAHSFRSRTKARSRAAARGGGWARAARLTPRPRSRRAHMVPVCTRSSSRRSSARRASPLLMWWSHWKMDQWSAWQSGCVRKIVTVGPTTFPWPPETSCLSARGDRRPESFPSAAKGPRTGGSCASSSWAVTRPRKESARSCRAVRIALDRGADLRLDVFRPALTGEARAERATLQQLLTELELARPGALGRDSYPHGGDRPLGRRRSACQQCSAARSHRLRPEQPESPCSHRTGPMQTCSSRTPSTIETTSRSWREDRGDCRTLTGRARRDRREIRIRVAQEHSVDSWADGLLRDRT